MLEWIIARVMSMMKCDVAYHGLDMRNQAGQDFLGFVK